MRLAIGADHRGYELKKALIAYLKELGHSYKDMGCFGPEPCDYPDPALAVGQGVASGECEAGIIICGTGIGSCIAVNKVRGVRGALCHDVFTAQRARLHNNANVLCLGAEVVTSELAKEIVKAFLTTGYEGGRHDRRLKKIEAIEGLTTVRPPEV